LNALHSETIEDLLEVFVWEGDCHTVYLKAEI
jgi:hypothetical protein